MDRHHHIAEDLTWIWPVSIDVRKLPDTALNPLHTRVVELNRDACYRALLTRDARFDGRMFTAVKTTGIYCRPICPARPPKRTNCVFFSTAIAAQSAGFRPCLRCRPEISPQLAAWHGTSNTVARALSLIETGTADDQDLDRLADRLGVGERHLRRLFQEHVGISPKGVLQTRRILFAKQLITDSALPLTDVALAAGFSSIRTFNHAMQLLYGRPPSDFRRRRDSLDVSHVRLLLPYSPPYDWESMISFLQARTIPGVESIEEGRYRRTISLNGKQGTVCVADRPEAHSLEAKICFPDVRTLPEIVRRVRALFDLGSHPATIEAHFSKDPVLAPLVAARPGLRVPGAWDGFEMAIRAILGQQITVAGATKLASTLAATYGEAFQQSAYPELSFVFPMPGTLAASDLGSLGMPEARKKTIRELSRVVDQDPHFFDVKRDLAKALETLCALPGIGKWTANYIAMRALREPDAFPAQDAGLLRALAQRGVNLKPDALLKHAEQWRPWRAYATMHLWTGGTKL